MCIKTTAQTHDHLYRGEHIGISFLAHDQAAVSSVFARSGGDKFANVAWHPGSSGVPVLDDSSAYLETEIEQRLAAGTHTIFVGRVVAADAPARPPLVYYDAGYYDGAKLVSVDDT